MIRLWNMNNEWWQASHIRKSPELGSPAESYKTAYGGDICHALLLVQYIDPELRGLLLKRAWARGGVSLKSHGSCQLYLLGHDPSQCNWIFPCVDMYMNYELYITQTGDRICILFGFPCEMDLSHHAYTNPTWVACDKGGIRRRVVRNPFSLILYTSRHVSRAKYTAQSWRSWQPCEMDLYHKCSLHEGSQKYAKCTQDWIFPG